jgi:hypothetical protein
MVTDLVAVPPLFLAVIVYVVVNNGFTVILVLPSTLPTPLFMVKDVGEPPESVQLRALEPPCVIVVIEALKELIAGGGGVTDIALTF